MTFIPVQHFLRVLNIKIYIYIKKSFSRMCLFGSKSFREGLWFLFVCLFVSPSEELSWEDEKTQSPSLMLCVFYWSSWHLKPLHRDWRNLLGVGVRNSPQRLNCSQRSLLLTTVTKLKSGLWRGTLWSTSLRDFCHTQLSEIMRPWRN